MCIQTKQYLYLIKLHAKAISHLTLSSSFVVNFFPVEELFTSILQLKCLSLKLLIL